MNKRLERIKELFNKTDNVDNGDDNIKKINHQPENIKKRLDRIKELIEKTDDIDNNKNITKVTNTQIENIKNKFSKLDIYVHIEPEDLCVGNTIRYYTISNDKLSMSGVITSIEYFSIINKNQIKNFHLYNGFKKSAWSIACSDKYVLFNRKFKLTANERNIKDYLDNILSDEIKKYNKNNN